MYLRIRKVVLSLLLTIFFISAPLSSTVAAAVNNDQIDIPNCVSDIEIPEKDNTNEQDAVAIKKCATATPVTFEDPTCGKLGNYTIPTSDGVDYTVNQQVVAAGTYEVQNGQTVTVVAVAQQGFAFEEGAVTEWTYKFNVPTDCTPTPKTVAQVTVKPSGPVNAGVGMQSTHSNLAIITGFLLSALLLIIGLLRKVNS